MGEIFHENHPSDESEKKVFELPKMPFPAS